MQLVDWEKIKVKDLVRGDIICSNPSNVYAPSYEIYGNNSVTGLIEMISLGSGKHRTYKYEQFTEDYLQWYRKFKELPYDPTQQGDTDEDI